MKLRMSKKTQNLSYIKFQKWTVRKLINHMDFWAKTWNLRMSGSKGIKSGARLQLLHHKFLLAMQVVILGRQSWVGMSLLMKLYTQTSEFGLWNEYGQFFSSHAINIQRSLHTTTSNAVTARPPSPTPAKATLVYTSSSSSFCFLDWKFTVLNWFSNPFPTE